MLIASTSAELIKAAGGVLIALITVYGGARVTNGVRHQTTPEKGVDRERERHPVAGEAMGREVEGYIVRFFIFSLVASFWGAVLNIVIPLWEVHGKLQTVAISIVYTAIFVALGLPLLVDISRKYGVYGRRRLRVVEAKPGEVNPVEAKRKRRGKRKREARESGSNK